LRATTQFECYAVRVVGIGEEGGWWWGDVSEKTEATAD